MSQKDPIALDLFKLAKIVRQAAWRRYLGFCAAGGGLIASIPAIAWAQGAEEESKGPEWVLNYAAVVLCVGLALAGSAGCEQAWDPDCDQECVTHSRWRAMHGGPRRR